jgi:hypothetical protein
MRMKFLLITAVAGGTTALMSGTAGAMMPGNSGMGAAVDGIAITEDVQYGWQGRQYCFYDDGWHGAGWYRCGYRLRVGFGWGGPVGWHGWRQTGSHEGREFRGRGEGRRSGGSATFGQGGRDGGREGMRGGDRGGSSVQGGNNRGSSTQGGPGRGTSGAGPTGGGAPGGGSTPSGGGAGTQGGASGAGGAGGGGAASPGGGGAGGAGAGGAGGGGQR